MTTMFRSPATASAAALLTIGTATGAQAVDADNVSDNASAGNTTETTTDTAIDATSDSEPAIEVLETLEVTEDSSMDGYDRAAQFGGDWTDVDDTGCTTREDILIRDLDDETLSIDGDCRVEYGQATDPYTATTMEHVLGQSEVDIEHVVSAGQAWRNGADQWDQQTREAFYQDKDNLVAVSSSANQSKSDLDAAEWLPENQALYCDFVGTMIHVKDTYGLAVNPAEHAEMQRILTTDDCQGTPATPAETLMHGETESSGNHAPDTSAEPVPNDPYAGGSDYTIDENMGMWGLIIVAALLVLATVARTVIRGLAGTRSTRRRW